LAVSIRKRSLWRGRRSPWITAAAIVAGATAFGIYQGVAGSPPASAEAEAAPAIVEPVKGTDLARVTLSESAIERLDVRTVPVRKVSVRGRQRSVVPYAAVLYDTSGHTWVYTSPKARTFVRQRITVESISGNRAVLSAGPASGTRVVTVGVQELYGAEIDY
jgi:hypothetical protein